MATFAPAGGHLVTAAAAGEIAAQREVLDGDAVRALLLAGQSVLNRLIRLEIDQGFVLRFAQRDIPTRNMEISGIERLGQEIVDPLMQHDTVTAWCELGPRFQKPLHFGRRCEASAGETFEGFCDDPGSGLIAHEDFAATLRAAITIAPGCPKTPKAIERPCAHPVERLFAILLALMLRDRSEQVLDQHAVGIFAELDRGRLERAARPRDIGAKLEVCRQTARQTRDIVDDHDQMVFALAAEIIEHRIHAGPGNGASRCIVLEDLDDLEPAIARELAAARLLRRQPVAARCLLRAANPAVDDSLLAGHCLVHGLVLHR